MHPTQLAGRLGLSPETLAKVCEKLQITSPGGADGAFSAEQVRQISEFVEARQRAKAQPGQAPPPRELGERSFGDQKSNKTPKPTRPLSEALGDPVTPAHPSEPGVPTSYGGKPSTKPVHSPATPVPPTAPVSGIAATIAVLPLEMGYDILQKLGEGGMGSVFLGKEKSSGREVAIKRLNTGGATEEALETLIEEFRNGCKLSHLNIVRFLSVNRDDEGPYFTMEYVDGEALSKRLKRGPIDLATALDIFTPLADGLQHAHDKQQVHRDIKPGNILLTKGGMPKLADFGLAMNTGRDEGGSDFVGTLDFMPPEQRVDSRLCTAASDQWSFAATIYYALTKQPPREYDPGKVPAAIRPILTQALQDAPNKRFKSMAEMAQALERCARFVQKAADVPEFVPEEPTRPSGPAARATSSTTQAVPVAAVPVNVAQVAGTAAILGAAYGFWPGMLFSWLGLMAGGGWWGHAFFTKQRGMAPAAGIVLGIVIAFVAGLFIDAFADVAMLWGMAAGSLALGVAAAMLYREEGVVKVLGPSLATAVVLGGLGIVWVGLSSAFTTPGGRVVNNNGGNGGGNNGGNETQAVKIEPNDLVFTGQELENKRVTWQIQGHLKTNDGQVTGQLTFTPARQKQSATMDVEGTFDGWRLELNGKSVSNPNLIQVANYVLTLDDETNKFTGQLENSQTKLEGTVTHWPEHKQPKFVPDGVVDEFVERFDNDLPPGQLPAGWKGDTTIGLVEQGGRRGLSPSGKGQHTWELPPLKLHGDFLFESTVDYPQAADNTLRFTFRGSPGHPDLVVNITIHTYGGEQHVSLAGGEAKGFPNLTSLSHRYRLEKRGEAFSFYHNGFLVHSVRLPKHVSFEGITGQLSGNAPAPILIGFRTSGLGPLPEGTAATTETYAALPYVETFAATPLTKLPAGWVGPPTMGVASLKGTPVLGATVNGMHSAVSPAVNLTGDFTAEFDYFVENKHDQAAEFTLLGQRGTPDLNVTLVVHMYGGETHVQLDGTDAKPLKGSPGEGILSIKRTGDAFVVAINGTMLNTLRIPNAGSYRGVRVTLPGGEPLSLRAVRLYTGSQRPTVAVTPVVPTTPATPTPTDKETKFVIKAALAKNLISEQVTLTVGGQTFNWEVTEKKPSISLPITLKLEPGTYPYKVTGKSQVRLAPNRPGVGFTCEAGGEITIAPDKVFTYVSDATVNVQEKTYQPEFH